MLLDEAFISNKVKKKLMKPKKKKNEKGRENV